MHYDFNLIDNLLLWVCQLGGIGGRDILIVQIIFHFIYERKVIHKFWLIFPDEINCMF